MASKKLLVADDSLTIQKVIRLALSNEGYEIQAVSDGNDAIQQISVFRPHVVLIDVSLPGKSAFELKREINSLPDLREVRFILMSSAFEKVDEVQAEEVHFHERLTKPFDPAHLREVLSSVLSQISPEAEPTMRIEPPQVHPEEPSLSPPSHQQQDEWQESSPFLPPPRPDHFAAPPPSFQSRPELPPELPELPDHQIAEPEFAPPPSYTPPPPAAATPSAPPPATNNFSSPDADIRKLTESTIRMSGLDDFEWSVQEPSLKPPGSLLSSEELTGASSASAYFDAPEEVPYISQAPSPPPTPTPTVPHSTGRPSSQNPSAPTPPAASATPAATGPIPQLSPLSSELVAEVIRKELQKILPEIAEKLIKQEIHKMLSEQP